MDSGESITLFAPGSKKRRGLGAGSETSQQLSGRQTAPPAARGLQPGSNDSADDSLVRKKDRKRPVRAHLTELTEAGAEADGLCEQAAQGGNLDTATQEEQADAHTALPERAQGETSTSQARNFKELGLSEWLDGGAASTVPILRGP